MGRRSSGHVGFYAAIIGALLSGLLHRTVGERLADTPWGEPVVWLLFLVIVIFIAAAAPKG